MGNNFLLKVCLFAYVVSTAFTDVLSLPGMWSKIQVPDIVFLPLFGLWSFVMFREKNFLIPKFQPFEWAIFLYIIFSTASAFHSGEQSAWMEVAGFIYLFTVYLIFKTSIRLIIHPVRFVNVSFITCGIIASLTGIVGWGLSSTGIDTVLAMPADHPYPYLGPIPRATGWMVSPNMLFNLIGVALLIYLPIFLKKKKRKGYDLLVLFVLCLGALLTFSKSLLLLIICILIIATSIHKVRQNARSHIAIICGVLFLIFLAGTHILIRKENQNLTDKREGAYTAAKPFLEWNGLKFYKTNYTINKSAALQAGVEDPILGVGPGQFNSYVGKLKQRGKYPDHFINFDPHSTFLGAFAEGGLPLFFIIIFMAWQIIKLIRKRMIDPGKNELLTSGIAATFLFMGMEAISMDILNFRHLWILFAVLVSLPFLQRYHEEQELFSDQANDVKSIGENQ